jgi:hypothetical protein
MAKQAMSILAKNLLLHNPDLIPENTIQDLDCGMVHLKSRTYVKTSFLFREIFFAT